MRIAFASATSTLDAGSQADSNDWYELGERVSKAAWRLGSDAHDATMIALATALSVTPGKLIGDDEPL